MFQEHVDDAGRAVRNGQRCSLAAQLGLHPAGMDQEQLQPVTSRPTFGCAQGDCRRSYGEANRSTGQWRVSAGWARALGVILMVPAAFVFCASGGEDTLFAASSIRRSYCSRFAFGIVINPHMVA